VNEGRFDRTVLVALGLALCLATAVPTSERSGTAAPPTAADGSWTVYHGSADGSGVAAGIASVDVSHRAWTSPALDGQLYGEPLVSSGRVFMATESDTIYALSTLSGAVVWSTHLGAPVPSSALPCGNISPTVGITGTPVIDEARSEIFAVADELVGGLPAHVLVGLDTTSGKVELSQPVDPSRTTPAALLERTGLTLDSGHVVFGFGGNFGDCGSYHGWVVSVPESGGTPATFTLDSGAGESQGAVWMGGAAPVVDAAGNVWVTVGNGSVTSSNHAYDDSDSVLELSPALTLIQYFAPSSWASNNARDLDLATTPALLSDGQVVASGKTGAVYLLNAHSLGGIGGQQSLLSDACGDAIDGGVAVQGTTVYLPCLSGPLAVQATAAPAGLRVLWHAAAGGGPPVLVAGHVWTISPDGTLYGLDPATGNVVTHADVGGESNHFPTPAVGAGLLVAPSSLRVVAFTATASTTTTTTTTSTSTPRPTTTTTGAPASPSSGLSGWAITGIVIGGLAVAGVAAWLLYRRNRHVPRP
jgi:outer membrane protein assembly factor BamB